MPQVPGVFETRAADTTLRDVPIPPFREVEGAFEDVEELAEEGLFPSTESSSSKFLSAEEKKYEIHTFVISHFGAVGIPSKTTET